MMIDLFYKADRETTHPVYTALPSIRDYFVMTRIPAKEMCSSISPEDIAMHLINHTRSSRWQLLGRREMLIGDGFTYKGTFYMLINRDNAHQYPYAVTSITDIPELGLVYGTANNS